MGLYVENKGGINLDVDYAKEARSIVETVLEFEGCPYKTEIELILTDDASICAFNKEYREIDQATDVLSFPMVNFIAPGKFDFLEDNVGVFNPDTGELVLGTIIISKERVLAQAEEFGHSVRREYAFLIVHSVLHLLGYDHVEEKERCTMENRQTQILDILEILR